MTDDLLIRPAGPDEANYIRDSFWRAYRHSHYAHGTDPRLLIDLLTRLLVHPEWSTLVCVEPTVPDEVLAWVTYKNAATIAWIDVKPMYRGRGIAQRLLQHIGVRPGPIACAFIDPRADKFARPRGLVLRYRPYLPLTA